ncbi:hypothetical protein G647_01034 [Cladophialophora carrionii CBS 160.54]|uniref:Tachykinin family protein n=1 Tax=Cladophialophora carrionii CBS 160.54 TaxID=1279043 RepID=V9DNV5_9EURO|nr:uncharacterized protein G647_01034 [Cladophialophora carrionii CBS 160.54]ETI28584.1 hypothetical protein G647_01034 [Cladophialophora carrionii CBS 160.54]
MSDPTAEEPTKPDRSEAPPRLRFVTARPDTKQGKQEAKAAIRAHASQASWAKIRKKGKQLKQPGIGSGDTARPDQQQQHRLSSAGEPASSSSSSSASVSVSVSGSASTALVSRFDDDPPHNVDHASGAPASARQVVPSRAARQSILGSISVPSPLRTVGAGDVDPFTSYPSRLPKEVAAPIISQVNHFLNIIFLPDPDRPTPSIVERWISCYMKDSTFFHAICFAQLARSLATETRLKPINRKAYWYCYAEVVREVNRRFNDPAERCSDETIFAVQALAFHGDATTDEADTPRSPSQGPMNSMQGLDIYAGRLNPVSMHVNGLARMLALRGGIADIELPGLAAMLSYGDLLLASRSLHNPVYPFVPIGESPARSLADVSRTDHPLAKLGTGFQVLRDLISNEESAQRLLSTLCNLAAYSLGVYDYIMGRPQAPSLRILADQRNFVQHSLMQMCATPSDRTAEAATNNPLSTLLLEEACWSAAAVYSLIAVFPVPHPNAPFAELAKQLKQHLVDTSSHFARTWQKPSPLVLWMTFMGALASMAAEETKEENAWYITVLERLVHRMEIPSWVRLKDLLMDFLWFPNTSDPDGQQLWKEIHTSNPFG